MENQLSFREQVALVRLHSISGYGDKAMTKDFARIQDPEELFAQVTQSGEYKPRLSQKEAENLAKKAQADGIQIIPLSDKDTYPDSLRELYDPPPIIYKRGPLDLNQVRMLAVVGTRRHTDYGKRVTYEFVRDMVKYDFTIVSGMALGIDSFAHEAAIGVQGKTVAVLGSGVDIPTPMQNFRIYTKIIDSGCVISEFPLGSEAGKFTFPKRNRIISALSEGVLVVEAGEKSGALITADYALEMGKEVFALPGLVDSHASMGTNRLIQSGAKLVMSTEDILEELSMLDVGKHIGSAISNQSLDEDQNKVMDLLGERQGVEINEVVGLSDLESEAALSAIAKLELMGFVQRVGENSIRRL